VEAALLGGAGALRLSASGGNLVIDMPDDAATAARGQHAYVIRLRGLETR
jgi:hypothetical protein